MNSLKIVSLMLLVSFYAPLASNSEKTKKHPSAKEKLASTAVAVQLTVQQVPPTKEASQETKESVAAKLAESKWAIEHARAQHAQHELEDSRELLTTFREELDRVKKELEITLRALKKSQEEAQELRKALMAAQDIPTKETL